jgi:hypothetical protein
VSRDEEELARQLAEELKKLRVEDVVIQSLVQISSIGYRRLGLTSETKEDRDLGQVRVAIETMRALVPVLQQVVPAELVRDFESSVANLQLAYAKAATEAQPARQDASPEAPPGEEAPRAGEAPPAREAPPAEEAPPAGEAPPAEDELEGAE